MKFKREKTPGIKKFQESLKNLDNARAKTGWFETAKYPNGTPVAYVAAIQEYGSVANKIPSRSFMRRTVAEKQQDWKNDLAKGAKLVLNGKNTIENVLEAVSGKAAGQVRKTIATIDQPALSPVTILLRKWKRQGKVITKAVVFEAINEVKKNGAATVTGVSIKPLVDSRYLINTLTNIIEKK